MRVDPHIGQNSDLQVLTLNLGNASGIVVDRGRVIGGCYEGVAAGNGKWILVRSAKSYSAGDPWQADRQEQDQPNRGAPVPGAWQDPFLTLCTRYSHSLALFSFQCPLSTLPQCETNERQVRPV